jgi:hypothetical protein
MFHSNSKVNKVTFAAQWYLHKNGGNDLYFRTVHVVIFILFKSTHALFLKHIHI